MRVFGQLRMCNAFFSLVSSLFPFFFSFVLWVMGGGGGGVFFWLVMGRNVYW